MIRTRVLLAEDNVLVALDLVSEIEASGMVMSGVTGSAAQALLMIDQRDPDVAILNVGLEDGVSFSAAARLRALNIPFVFLTGCEKDGIHPDFWDIPRLSKPQLSCDVVARVAGIVEGVHSNPDSIGLDGRQASGEGYAPTADQNR